MPVFTNNPLTSNVSVKIPSQSLCRKYKGFLPNINPIIYFFSNDECLQNSYLVVYVNGENFTPNNLSVTFGSITGIPIVFYSSFQISFIVPSNLSQGFYSVKVVANNNNNYIPGLLYSNSVFFEITI
jgi:hypothetical protein